MLSAAADDAAIMILIFVILRQPTSPSHTTLRYIRHDGVYCYADGAAFYD